MKTKNGDSCWRGWGGRGVGVGEEGKGERGATFYGLHFMAYILSKSQCVTVALKSMQCIALPIHLIIQHSKE